MTATRSLPVLTAVLIGATYFAVAARTPVDAEGTPQWHAVALLPCVDRGRIKPLDTVARTSLMVISGGRQELPLPEGGSLPAIAWLIDAMSAEDMQQGKAADYPIFRIDNDQLLSVLKLEVRQRSYRYSLAEILPNFEVLDREIERANRKDPKTRDLFDERVLELSRRLKMYLDLVQHTDPLLLPPSASSTEWQSFGVLEKKIRQGVREETIEEMRRKKINPKDLTQKDETEIFEREASQIDKQLAAASPAASVWRSLLSAHRTGQTARFNQAVAELTRMTAEEPYMNKVRYEVWFNHFIPFYHCSVLYVGVFILVCLGWMAAPPLGRAAFGLAWFVLLVHTAALIARMYIQDRPPVTNLYSSAVFIGWGAVALALVLEAIYRNGLGTAVASVTGFASLLIAHHLAAAGDTLEMMQAVLDTNFWLATHVTTVNLGYTATFVAGFLGIAYILLGVAVPLFDREGLRKISRMTYGVICFAMLLSFVGTVLGGIWADQSWGRFWGWDPKENGAVLIVLWNAMILHARWGGLIKERGIAVMAVFGNIVTAWSWFGTNQLGVGLHSYGFTSGVATTMVLFDLAMLLVMTIGLVPTKYWAAYRMKMPVPPAPAMK